MENENKIFFKKDNKNFFKKKDKFLNIITPVFITKAHVGIIPRYYRYGGKSKAENQRLMNTLKERELYIDAQHGSCPVFESDPRNKTLCVFRFAHKEKTEKGKVIVEICLKVPPDFDEIFTDPRDSKKKLESIHADLLSKDVGHIKILPDDVMEFGDITETDSSISLKFPFECLNNVDMFNKKVCYATNNVTFTVENICKRYQEGIDVDGIKNERIIMAEEIEIMLLSNTTNDLMVVGRMRKTEHKNMPIKCSVDVTNNTVSFKTVEVGILEQIKNICDNKVDCDRCTREIKCMKKGTACSWSVVKNTDKRKNIWARMIFDRDHFVVMMTKLIYFSEGTLN